MDTTASNKWGDRYTPGQVVVQSGRDEYFVPLLFVSALADSAFWDRHCFAARGVESRDGRRLIRLDFSPTLDVRDPIGKAPRGSTRRAACSRASTSV